MRPILLERLVCPRCHGGLELCNAEVQDGDIVAGALACWRCLASYPVHGGIPRFVDDGDYASSFGRQWTWFRRVQLDSQNGTRESAEQLAATTGWSDDDVRGRLVLDAGVGAGRYAEVVAAQGAEVVGVDLTCAVDAARQNLGASERVHLVQADLFALPFRDASFDLAYSIGVLHHTPDVRQAFRRLAAAVKPDGQLAVYLYEDNGLGHRGSDFLRHVTTRLPTEIMLALSALAVPAYPLYQLPLVGKVLNLACPISPHPSWRTRWLDTFDWYTPRYQWKLRHPEVLRWFRECGFAELRVADAPIRVCGRRAPGAHT
jgi:SAM-dependent methyltransferase